ncbi:hypothetical protein [Marinicellulosiphila megalodicopiae]|uniref:hypothetical protein n=1 Tax=Marinicellulosiphila megalodicopiae TaxID=2724896 RepID=UPI003BB1D0DE
MRPRTVFLIVLFVFSGILSCSCPGPYTFKIDGVSIRTEQISTQQSYLSGSTINFSDLSLTIYIHHTPEPLASTSFINWSEFSFIQPVLATSQCYTYYDTEPSESITKIEIYSNSDFDDETPQGTNLIDRFNLFYNSDQIAISLLGPPETNSTHVFNFKVYFQDGTFYELFTDSISFS